MSSTKLRKMRFCADKDMRSQRQIGFAAGDGQDRRANERRQERAVASAKRRSEDAANSIQSGFAATLAHAGCAVISIGYAHLVHRTNVPHAGWPIISIGYAPLVQRIRAIYEIRAGSR